DDIDSQGDDISICGDNVCTQSDNRSHHEQTCHQGRDEKFENLDDKRTTHHGSITSLISQPATGVFRGQGPTPLFTQATPIFTANTEQQPGVAHSPLPKAQCNCPAIVHSSTAQRGEEGGGPES
ncbi:hypothetical protein KUCAC02_023773, partial [Chaenocephalus aceratus]